jgi:hypothetical protein
MTTTQATQIQFTNMHIRETTPRGESTVYTVSITNYLVHVSVFVAPSSGRPLRYVFKCCSLFAMFSHIVLNTVN